MALSKLKTSGVDHVVLRVQDVKRARQFYVDVLGMEIVRDEERVCFVRCGDQQIGLQEVRDGADIHAGAELNHLALRLESGVWEEARALLEAAGCEILPRAGRPYGLYFKDPEGHELQLITPAEAAVDQIDHGKVK